MAQTIKTPLQQSAQTVEKIMTKSFLIKSLTLACSFCLLTILNVGCGGGGPKGPSGTVSGTVTYQGQPVTEGVVNIFNTQSSEGGQGQIKSDGSYQISTPSSQVPVGEYDVYVVPPTVTTPDSADGPGGEEYKVVENIPDKYRSSSTSGLKVTVNEGSNPFNISMDE
ncbi:hypothetical protein [uncultured Rubinisphaera sp.]|uniref:hypothetical protein n=2 Tax=Rubinisphaera TaxID=1649490 RepID=UPI0030D9E4DC